MMTLQPEFVEFVPEKLEPATLYVSMLYRTVTHLCPCGCGSEIVTPISPTDWHLHFDGETISLSPSIGNWSLPCRSHYCITKNKIHFAGNWSSKQISSATKKDIKAKRKFFQSRKKNPQKGKN